jgi:hypothetical protein
MVRPILLFAATLCVTGSTSSVSVLDKYDQTLDLAPPDDGAMIISGVGYELTIRSGTDHTFAKVQGPRDHSVLIEWMEMVEKAVQKSSKREMVKKK